MSSYSRIVFFVILLLSSVSCAKQQSYIILPQSSNLNQKEDLYLLMALDSEQKKKVNDSFKYYKKLYDLTKNENYIKKAIAYSYETKQFKILYSLSSEAIKLFPKHKEYYTRQLVISLLAQNNLKKALNLALVLLKEFKNSINYEIIANIYYTKKDYKNSLKYYESAYIQNQNEKTLLKLVTILYTYLDKKDVALAYLETYLQTKGCSLTICNKLMLIYQEQGNVNGMLSILNKMYNKYKNNPTLAKTSFFIQNLIVQLLEKKDIKEAIKFLEKNKFNNTKLINLYYQSNQLKKALKLTKKLYKKTKKAELLGKIAMYRFELAKDKKKVMKTVIANFELALSSGINNASYQNYYGYLLINFDINIKKGILLIKKALKTSPNNIAYLDSLSWGYYKLKKCKKSLKIMSRVIQVTGLKDLEIKFHWNKIQKCNKGKNR
jgi:tetratricopeptide (TPR) repeat protein